MVRLKSRYLLMEIKFENGPLEWVDLTPKIIQQGIIMSMQATHGDFGVACVQSSLRGTIKSCQQVLVKHNREQIVKMLAKCKTPAEKEKLSAVLAKLPDVESKLMPKKMNKRKQERLAKKY